MSKKLIVCVRESGLVYTTYRSCSFYSWPVKSFISYSLYEWVIVSNIWVSLNKRFQFKIEAQIFNLEILKPHCIFLTSWWNITLSNYWLTLYPTGKSWQSCIQPLTRRFRHSLTLQFFSSERSPQSSFRSHKAFSAIQRPFEHMKNELLHKLSKIKRREAQKKLKMKCKEKQPRLLFKLKT